MPYSGEHAARLRDPSRYKKFRRENGKFGPGIDAIWGILPDGKVELQAVRFAKDKFTAAEARTWMSKHPDMGKVILFEAPSQEMKAMETKAIRRRAFGAKVQELAWQAADVNDLPDSCFLYVKDGGSKDDGDRTTPRSLRMFPYRDSSGKVDLPHLRNAIARIPQADIPQAVKDRLQAKARKILENANA